MLKIDWGTDEMLIDLYCLKVLGEDRLRVLLYRRDKGD